jgi:hypothetical protein
LGAGFTRINEAKGSPKRQKKIRKQINGHTGTETERQQGDLISLLSFFKVRKVG